MARKWPKNIERMRKAGSFKEGSWCIQRSIGNLWSEEATRGRLWVCHRDNEWGWWTKEDGKMSRYLSTRFATYRAGLPLPVHRACPTSPYPSVSFQSQPDPSTRVEVTASSLRRSNWRSTPPDWRQRPPIIYSPLPTCVVSIRLSFSFLSIFLD